MALNADHLRFVLLARDSGVRFDRPLMIGRQELYLDASTFGSILAAAGFPLNEDAVCQLLQEEDGFADPLFRLLGAGRVDSMDASAYEGATMVHDLNEPIPSSLRSRYSVVIDSGSLEHVFNIAQALRNCLEMVDDGGHFIAIGPANNTMGHGFYQFSPELYFRILSPHNGFRIERILAKEMRADAPWYAVADPAAVGHRVEWQSLGETHLMVCARKERTVEIFHTVPQQSDYVPRWTPDPAASRTVGLSSSVHHHVDHQWTLPPKPSLRGLLWRPVPRRAKTAYRLLKRISGVMDRVWSQPDANSFTRVDLPQLRAD
jgi:hypothetical protein